MLKRYLSNKIRSINRWIGHPERSDDTTSELDAQEQVFRYETVRDEVVALGRLRTPAVQALLKAGVRLQFGELNVTIGANYAEGEAHNELYIEDEGGQRKRRAVFSTIGIDTLIKTVEEDVLRALKHEDALAAAA